ncbi:type 2 DNA topoisomerase 6 subunit B-like [Ochotona curzoniae]|uniref:type 2 DNA topoisomerase 6 subunit B-like n=1 Tax=Ochotona curzoniae TaxID=130825 RepID=UPI001B351131|nr:type 2 DNA topoisomerase 6 subunit B-like [Ochotona curzoniae]
MATAAPLGSARAVPRPGSLTFPEAVRVGRRRSIPVLAPRTPFFRTGFSWLRPPAPRRTVEAQAALRRLAVKQQTWTAEESSCPPDGAGAAPFRMSVQVDEKPRILTRDCLIIKHFLHRIILVHPKIRFNFRLEVNGVLSTNVFRIEDEPALSLSDTTVLVVSHQHYVSSEFGTVESHCGRIHPVLAQPVTLLIPDDVAGTDLLGELVLTTAAALCPGPGLLANQPGRMSSLYIFLYGPLGLPLMLSAWEEPITAVFKDTSYFIDWKKYNLCVTPNLDLDLDRDSLLPDVSYRVVSRQGEQSQGQTLLLFLFVDFHSGFPVQPIESWGVHTLLTAHLGAVLRESCHRVRESVQFIVDQVLQQQQQAAKSQQRLQASLSVAVNSILTVVTGSTSSSFRETCLQALQASDTRELGTKLHKAFREITQQRLHHRCSCDRKQQLTPEEASAQDTEAAREHVSADHTEAAGAPSASKRRKEDERPAPRPARAPSPPAAPGVWGGLEDALWLQEVSNLSEWLRPGPAPRAAASPPARGPQ